jgi:hypothetical protein
MVQYLHFFVLRVLRYLILPYILCVVNFFGQIGAAQRRISAFFTKIPPEFVENKQKGRAYDTDGSAWGSCCSAVGAIVSAKPKYLVSSAR